MLEHHESNGWTLWLGLQDGGLPHPGTQAESQAPAQGAGEAGTTADGSNQNTAPPPSNPLGMLLPFAILILFMWFFVMRPERKRQKARAAMLSAVQKGDRIVTAGGLHGEIVSLDDATFTLKVGDNTRMKFDRSAVGRVESSRGESSEAGNGSPALARASR